MYFLYQCLLYFKSRPTSVNVALLVASKFSTKFVTLYFMKLIVRINVPLHLVANFVLWFRHQQITVRWDLSNFNCYSVINGPC